MTALATHPQAKKRCSVDGCNGVHRCLDLCSRHYSTQRRYGYLKETRVQYSLSLSRQSELKSHIFRHRKITEPHPILGTPCWEWTRSLNSNKYGQSIIDGKPYLVTRVIASIFWGMDLKNPIYVLHKCDNPPCFNPSHLFLGTQKDNAIDMSKKGRCGNGTTVLNIHKANRIRLMSKLGEHQQFIADLFNVSDSTISDVLLNRRWKDIFIINNL